MFYYSPYVPLVKPQIYIILIIEEKYSCAFKIIKAALFLPGRLVANYQFSGSIFKVSLGVKITPCLSAISKSCLNFSS